MLSIQKVALYPGIVFILVSVAGYVAATMGHGMMGTDSMMLLGVFPVNVLHNTVHLGFGVWGVWASRGAARSVAYAFGSGAAYLVLACVGMFSPMLLGMVPIGGYDVWLHVGLAVGLAGAGFYASWFAPQLEQS